MRSPRFPLREKELEAIFALDNLKRVWRHKVRASLKTSYIQDPIEFLDFHIGLDANTLRLRKLVCDGTYRPSSNQRVLVEKSKGLCRQIVIPSVDDAIVLQVLSDALYVFIKHKAPTAKSFFAPEDHRFSPHIRAKSGAPKYGSLRAWLNFQRSILTFARVREYVAVTDIANYYDFVSYSHLRNIIAGLNVASETVLDMLIFCLSGMLWQPDYMPRVELGLPQMDLDAPRMLAHCFLYELDRFIEHKGGVDYARYMDDIDIGTDTIADARRMLRDIDLVLHTRQVRLNSGKTKIMTKGEAARHFKIRENMTIDVLTAAIGRKIASKKSVRRERAFLRRFHQKLAVKRAFDDGNGDKVLKRILGLSTDLDVAIHWRMLKAYLTERPSVRENVFRYISRRQLTKERLEAVEAFICSDAIVDDATYLEAAYALNEAVVARAFGANGVVSRVAEKIKGRGNAAFYGAVWLLSKYEEPNSLLRFVRDNFDVWRANDSIGRLVGGLYPILRAAGLHVDLDALIARARNGGAMDVALFHKDLILDSKRVAGIRPIAKQQNASKPLRITHSKWLLLLSILQNVDISVPEKRMYLTVHGYAWRDIFYRRRVRALPLDPLLMPLVA